MSNNANQNFSLYYDGIVGKLLAAYVYGNERLEAAIKFVASRIPPDAVSILDAGCGLGWSTWEFRRRAKSAKIVGLDFSEKIIETAKSLFSNTDISFICADLTEWNPENVPPFQIAVMIDSYEHIQKETRKKVHQTLNRILDKNGILFLTFPSVSYQEHLRKNNPPALQPVDENVTEDDIEQLASDLSAGYYEYKHVSIWRPNDYVHAYVRKGAELPLTSASVELEDRKAPVERIEGNLRRRITPDGIALPIQEGPTVCVVSPHANAESFVRSHLERLPASVRFLSGHPFDFRLDDGTKFLKPQKAATRVLKRLRRRFVSSADEEFSIRKFVQYIDEFKINAVLAEYGLTGALISEGCKEANVPLIVQFHGYDAYHREVLKEYASRYSKMFQSCSAIISVSQHMSRQLQTLGAPSEKLHLNPCGVDLEMFKGSDAEKAPPLIVSVGRFVDKKAPHLTILAFAKALKSCADARLVMIGDGPLREACLQLSRAQGIEHAVQLPGTLPQLEIAQSLKDARIFVQHSITTSYGDSEGTPVSILEAAASGLPIISTKHAGIVEQVKHEETGFLVEEGDVDGMAGYMIRLLQDSSLAGKMGKKGREFISENYSIEQRIAKLWEIIQKAIHAGV